MQPFSAKMYSPATRSVIVHTSLGIAVAALFVISLVTGPVELSINDLAGVLVGWIPSSSEAGVILLETRFPRALTALGAGAGLAACGLMMQTLFRNPLAGPSVLGITSGASLAVALVVLAQAMWLREAYFPSSSLIATSAMLGAAGVLAIVMAVASRLGNTNSLLLFGILLGHFVGAIESVLQHRSAAASVRAFVVWGMGRFSDTTLTQAVAILLTVAVVAVVLKKMSTRMNLYLTGSTYAESMGLSVRHFQWAMVALTGIVAGLITAWCGPVAFIGLAIPHVTRMLLRTSDHRRLLWPLLLAGAAAGLLSDVAGKLFSIPLNAVTSLLGVPVVIAVIFQSKKGKSVL